MFSCHFWIQYASSIVHTHTRPPLWKSVKLKKNIFVRQIKYSDFSMLSDNVSPVFWAKRGRCHPTRFLFGSVSSRLLVLSSYFIYVAAFGVPCLAALHADAPTGWCADIGECWDAGSCARNLLHLASFQSSHELNREHDGSPCYVEMRSFVLIWGHSWASGLSFGSIANCKRSLRNVAN